MSRSYRKFLSGCSEFDSFIRSKFRIQEHWCIREAMRRGADEDVVVFPRYFRSNQNSWCSVRRYFKSKSSIRNEYFKEIRNILNGYTDRYGNHEELFLECFNRIKGMLPPDGRKFRFEWLNSREAKAIISTWSGEPLDVLYYLTCARVIEKSVNLECKRCNRK